MSEQVRETLATLRATPVGRAWSPLGLPTPDREGAARTAARVSRGEAARGMIAGVTRAIDPARSSRVRLDQLLVERGLAESRDDPRPGAAHGRSGARAGRQGPRRRRATRRGSTASPATSSTRAAASRSRAPEPYVSRGGHKLAGALDAFGIDPAGRVCLDVGASTGGFTDVLLQRGAVRVHAIDVGRGQLAERSGGPAGRLARAHERPRLSPDLLGEPVVLAVVDVSFISLDASSSGPIARCSRPAAIVALVKPQFEAGARTRTDRGVVRDPAVHREVLERASTTPEPPASAPLGLAPRRSSGSGGQSRVPRSTPPGPGCAEPGEGWPSVIGELVG
jgi:23S rRNA (cytidine1920-2'-O)/16S rRNA (cytidine1409-2'-O)-methyltransferase